ncbi:MAG: VC0807 family protein [Azovibrio sp.]|uniref:VC0807 family protein n=1 Tax=Azovibrio sp. TaxID=1872673 RepID=UPI003C725FE4
MAPARNNNPLIELLINIIIPSLILMKLSGAERLGSVGALLLALAFPLVWGTRDLIKSRKFNVFSALGLVNILLTGGIGLLELDSRWLAIKEAAVPGIIGLVVLASIRTPYPLIKSLLFNPAIIDVDKVHQHLALRGNVDAFDARLQTGTILLSATFFFSAMMNYLLAIWIVTSPAGTEAFNAELGRLTLLSYPMIALPSMLMMMAVLYYLARSTRKLAGLGFMDILQQQST